MPRISRPESNIQRNVALRNAKARKDQVPPMPLIPYSAATITWLDTFQPIYKAKYDAVTDVKQAQTSLTAQGVYAKKIATFYVYDFVLNLNRAIRRDQLPATARTYYNIAVDDDSAVKIGTESQLLEWNERLTVGEADRIADGGAPILYPSVGDVNAKVAAFVALNDAQAPAMLAYDMALEELSALNPEADQLILKLWNETETAFDTGDKPSMRRKARLWGVVYEPTAGEVLDPADYSIAGKVTNSVTGKAIEEAIVRVEETNTIIITDSKGNYLIPVQPPGTYTIQVIKNGFDVREITGVEVTAEAVATLNIQLNEEQAVTTGTVSGQTIANGSGTPATVGVVGTTNVVVSDSNGYFTLTGVNAGMQNISAALVSNPSNIVVQGVNVLPNATVTVNFNFG